MGDYAVKSLLVVVSAEFHGAESFPGLLRRKLFEFYEFCGKHCPVRVRQVHFVRQIQQDLQVFPGFFGNKKRGQPQVRADGVGNVVCE